MGRPVLVLAVAATAILVKTGPLKVRTIQFHNAAATEAYLQMFDAAAAADVTVGTTIPNWAPGAHATAGGDDVVDLCGLNLMFTKGLVIASCQTPDGLAASAQLGVSFEIDD
jgi:hypothetical protein